MAGSVEEVLITEIGQANYGAMEGKQQSQYLGESNNVSIWSGTPCKLAGAEMGMGFVSPKSSTTAWQISPWPT